MIFPYASQETGLVPSVRLDWPPCAAMHPSAGIFCLLWKCGVSHLETEDCNGVCLLVYVTTLCSSLKWGWTCCSLKLTKINPQHYSLAHLVCPIHFLEAIGNYSIIQRYNLNLLPYKTLSDSMRTDIEDIIAKPIQVFSCIFSFHSDYTNYIPSTLDFLSLTKRLQNLLWCEKGAWFQNTEIMKV